MAIITTADLKSWINISDSEDDPSLILVASAAASAVTAYCGAGRNFNKIAVGSETAKTYRGTGPTQRYPYGWVMVDDFWSTTNLVVKSDDSDDGTYETTWTSGTDFILEPFGAPTDEAYYMIVPSGRRSFTVSSRPTVQVTAAWGWAAVPDDVKLATLIKAARLFKRRNSPEGVLGGWAEFGAVRVSNREDPDVISLLGRYRRPETYGIA